MTDKELQEIRERCEAATKIPPLYDIDAQLNFISHAKSDIPNLLDHIAQLQANNQYQHDVIGEYGHDIDQLQSQLIEVKAERDALAKELRRIMPDRKVADEAQTERQELK